MASNSTIRRRWWFDRTLWWRRRRGGSSSAEGGDRWWGLDGAFSRGRATTAMDDGGDGGGRPKRFIGSFAVVAFFLP